ncbi:LCP family protein [Terribacillus sp. DMT04]|uniref:LCP family protein n=1 Tax=Terribacillus sp. DMT04 TaxID=2850441 RepID=UPI001C2C1463|nr:LCP family protein [Terribacillus sp. DMT04]
MSRRSPNQSQPPRRTVKKKLKKKRIIMLILLPILILGAGGAAYAAHLYSSAASAIEKSHVADAREKSNLREAAVDPVEDNVSILFMGVDDSDTRDQSNSRSDAMILATFNKEEHSVDLLSIPRDSYVYVPEVDRKTKITHAHAYGGAQASVETVENFLNVPVDYYAEINFNAFMDIIDTLGGIEVEVPYELYEQNSKDQKNAIHLEEGLQELNGEEALALARTRHYDNDIERGKRQQEIIKAMISKASSASSIFKYDDLIQDVGDNLTTSLTFDQIKSFVSYGTSNELTINTLNLDGTGGKLSDGIWYYQVDPASLADAQKELREHLGLSVKIDTDSVETGSSGVYDSTGTTDGTDGTGTTDAAGNSSSNGYTDSSTDTGSAYDSTGSNDSTGSSSNGYTESSTDTGSTYNSTDSSSSYDSTSQPYGTSESTTTP